MKKARRLIFRGASFLIIALLLFGLYPQKLSAQTQDCTEKRLRDLGIAIINCAGNPNCAVNGPSLPSTGGSRLNRGSSVYVLGDSITVGMRDHGDLAGKLTAAGVNPVKINAVGGEDLGWGQEQLVADEAVLANAQAVVVNLGTNNVGSVVTNGSDGPSRAIEGGQQSLERMIQGIINTINPVTSSGTKKQIFWTTVYVKGTLSTRFGNFNMDIAMPIINNAIKNVAATNGVTIVPWDTSAEAPVWTAQDGIHPSGHYPEMATFLVNNLTNPGSQSTAKPTSNANCACTLPPGTGGADRDSRYRTTWGYLTGTKGLSPEAAAGVMGNLEAESGIDPHNVQNSAPTEDAPEIPIDIIRNRWGYGIAQWTTSGRQEGLIAFASQTNRSTGDLGLQLDYLWKELTEGYVGVMAVLQTPGVTLEEASYIFLAEFETPRPFTNQGTQAQRDEYTALRAGMSRAIYNEFSGQTVSGTTGAGCNSQGINIDLESTDTTAVPCGPGTTDAGVADGYRNGQLIKIRLCEVGGARVNSQISGGVAQMLNDSAAAGANLSINGAFRDMQGQIDIYHSWCSRAGISPTPGPYPKPSRDDYVSCPGGAPPGYSNHQAGLALDLECDGDLIPQSYSAGRNNRCFQWLTNNAIRYGLYEWGKGEKRDSSGYESWHWSVDGN